VSAQEGGCQRFVQTVLHWYTSLPDTPPRARTDDRWVALRFYRERIPLSLIEAAFLLGTVRRIFRNHELDGPVYPIRSIRYFLPVIQELQTEGVDPRYVDYLRAKLSSHVTLTSPPPVPTPQRQAPHRPRPPRQLKFHW
jgi:hypothetical protein